VGNIRQLQNPTAADYFVAIVEDGGVAGGDGALRLIEGDADAIFACGLNQRR
jgi:hypothetical protein